MDFEQYLEKDIITFLDGKIDKKENVLIDREEEYGIYMARDYLKELSYALDNEELTKAKRLFDDLKAKFSLLPKSSLERKKVYALLEKMYDKIQNYVKIKEGKIEIIKQGDSEVFKDTTEKFANITDMAVINKIEISPEVIKEFENEKHTESLIKIDKHDVTKGHEKTEYKEKKKYSNDDVSVESQIFGAHEKHDKDHEEKDSKSKHLEDENKQCEFREESTFEKEIMHAVERLIMELNKKIEEKDMETIREEMTKQVIKEIDKKFDVEKHILSNEREKIYKDILDQVYRKAKHVISEEDNKANHNTENIVRQKDNKIKYIIGDAHNSVMAIDITANQPMEDANKHKDVIIKHIVDDISKNAEYRNIVANDNENKKNKIVIHTHSDSDIKNFEDELSTSYDDFSRNARDMQKSGFNHEHNEESLRRLYEEAIHTMFQSDYAKAAKIFEKILRLKPENRAAKIRLYECVEAISNA